MEPAKYFGLDTAKVRSISFSRHTRGSEGNQSYIISHRIESQKEIDNLLKPLNVRSTGVYMGYAFGESYCRFTLIDGTTITMEFNNERMSLSGPRSRYIHWFPTPPEWAALMQEK